MWCWSKWNWYDLACLEIISTAQGNNVVFPLLTHELPHSCTPKYQYDINFVPLSWPLYRAIKVEKYEGYYFQYGDMKMVRMDHLSWYAIKMSGGRVCFVRPSRETRLKIEEADTC